MSLKSTEEKTLSLGVIAADNVGVLRPEAPEANPVPESSPRGDSQPEDRDLENELRDTANRIRQRTARCVLENGRDLLRWRDRLRYGQFRRGSRPNALSLCAAQNWP